MILIDIYFLLNFIFDFILLQSMVLILKKNRSMCRLLAGAAVGACWSCLAVIGILPSWLELPMTYLLCPYLMCRLSCRIHGWMETVLAFACFYVCACMGSGVMNLIYGHIGADHGLWGMLLLMAGAQLCLIFTFRIWNKKRDLQTLFCKIELIYHGRSLKTVGIWDTGNRLCTNAKRPVHLIDRAGANHLLNEEEKAAVDVFWKRLEGEQTEDCYENGLLLQPVPYCGVGGGQGILPAFTIDQMLVWRDGEAITLEKPVIGISETMFSSGRKYRIIINTMGM